MGFLDPPASTYRPRNAKCNVKKKDGRKCKQPAGFGTDHVGYGPCKLHLGTTKAHRVRAALMEASHEARVMGFPIDIDPMEGLLVVIRISAGEIAYMTDRISELTPKKAIIKKKKTISRAGDLDSYEEVEESNEAGLNIWISARHQAMERFAKFCKMAIDAGVAERQVKVAEGMGQMMGHLLSAVLGELNLNEAQKALAPSVVQKHMLLLEAGNPVATR